MHDKEMTHKRLIKILGKKFFMAEWNLKSLYLKTNANDFKRGDLNQIAK